MIERYPDRIELSNPGTIILGKEQMLKGGISDPRNKLLFKMLNQIGIGERAGSGVPDIFDTWKTEGLKPPKVIEQFGPKVIDRTTMILPLSEKKPRNLFHPGDEKGEIKGEIKGDVNRKTSILELMRRNQFISLEALSQETGLTKRQVERLLSAMRKEGKIRREGAKKTGKWVIEGEDELAHNNTDIASDTSTNGYKTSEESDTVFVSKKEDRYENRYENSEQDMVLRCESVKKILRQNPTASISSISKELGISRQKAQRAVNRLQQECLLRHEGSAKGGSWIVID